MYEVFVLANTECPRLSAPGNGAVTVNGFTAGDVAVYYCEDGFELVGDETRECMSNSEWSGQTPSCQISPGNELHVHLYIRESVDCLCRDGTNTPIKPNILNSAELLNGAVISLYRHIIWHMTVSIPSLKVGKVHSYN